MGHSFTELLARIIVPALQTTLYMVAIAIQFVRRY